MIFFNLFIIHSNLFGFTMSFLNTMIKLQWLSIHTYRFPNWRNLYPFNSIKSVWPLIMYEAVSRRWSSGETAPSWLCSSNRASHGSGSRVLDTKTGAGRSVGVVVPWQQLTRQLQALSVAMGQHLSLPGEVACNSNSSRSALAKQGKDVVISS